jgi:hypothetical protein
MSTGGVQHEYRRSTGGVQEEYRRSTGGVQEYRRSTGVQEEYGFIDASSPTVLLRQCKVAHLAGIYLKHLWVEGWCRGVGRRMVSGQVQVEGCCRGRDG